MKKSIWATTANRLGLALTVSGAGLTCIGVTPAHAGQAAVKESDNAEIGDIVVTARRRTESLQSVPVAVTALSGEDLARKSIATLENLNAHVPALRITKFQGSDALVVSIRGQRNSQAQPGQDPSIGVYFAEVPTGLQQGLGLGMFDLENVQVLKGPQGTLFGRNSTGGAILLSPAKPKHQFGGSIRAGYIGVPGGGGFTSTSTLNLPVGERVAFRFALNTVNRDGWQKNIVDPAAAAAAADLPAAAGYSWRFGKVTDFSKRLADQESYDWRVGMDFQATDRINNYLVYQGSYFHADNGLRPRLFVVSPRAPLAAVYAPYVARQLAGDFWSTQNVWRSPNTVKLHQAVDILTIETDLFTVKNIAGVKWMKRALGIDATGTPASMTQNVVNDYFNNGRDISEELQFQGKAFDDQLQWTIGGFYFDNRIKQTSQGSGFGYSGRPATAKSKTIAGYAQATYNFAAIEGLSVTAGGRYTYDKRAMSKQGFTITSTNCRLRNSPTDAGIPPGCLASASGSYRKFTYNTSVDYKIDSRSMVYFIYSTGYRAGGFNISENFLSAYVQGYKPETVENFEVGLKKDWDFGIPIRTNISGYTQKFNNVVRQAQNPTAVTSAVLVNATSARLKGFEAELSIKPVRGLELGASYGYVDAKYTGPFFPFAGSTFNAQNFEFSLVPKETLTVNGSYTLPLDKSVGEVRLSANYYHQSRMFWDDSQQGTSPGCLASDCGPRDIYSQKPYGTLDVRLDWKGIAGSRFDASLWATNVTKEKFNSSVVPLANAIGLPLFPGDPRFFGVDLTFHFGTD
ncbi:TonB-dependent receptor [Sphingobium sp.]|uniref:TonB-dependent receptor n=1 Tax=Sphingobium sp. TaxID=1912891 RepID=UPI0028BE5914|nr:TonB-dependent receptor [Sphingobium sp.]